VPIVFSSLILGLTRVSNAAQVGRYATKLLTGYLMTSLIAVVLGMGMAMLLQPGAGFTGLSTGRMSELGQHLSMIDWLVSLIPINPFEALSTGNLLQTIASAALIGVGISEKILSFILYVSPIGVFALISSVIATQGFDLIAKLFVYVAGLIASSTIMMGFYTLVLFVLKANPNQFFRSFFPAFSLAFGTASSNAALPIVLKNAQEGYGMREDIASFAIPLGTALKRDGSAILQGFNALFIAQIYHIPLTPSLLLAIALSTLLVSFSTAGVPGAGIIMMATVLSAAGLPVEGVAIVAGVDRLTDGFKTVLNVFGNTVNAVMLSHWEQGESLPESQVISS
jgi:proton glutamate symport protein